MKKIMVFLFLLIALCLIVSCGDASSDTEPTASVDTTTVPLTIMTTTETPITTPKQVTTTPATTKTVEVTTPETTEDDGMYRAGFVFSGGYTIPDGVIPVLIAYEITETCYYQAESVPITLFLGIPSNLIDYADMPEDSVFTVSLYNDANEEVCTLFDISLDEIKDKSYLCTIGDQKVTYAQEGKTFELDLSLFDGTSGKYLIKAKHSTETDDKWDVWGGVYLRYSQTLARDYYIFGK